MALFSYRASTRAGRLMTGTIEAGNVEQAKDSLNELDLEVNEVEKVLSKEPRGKIGRNDFVMFNEQLTSITKAGIPLEKGLRELARDSGSPRMRKLLNEISDDLERGIPIEKAVQKREKSFPPLYGLILKSGIETSRLSEMLAGLNRHIQIELRTRRIIIESLSYPMLVLAIAAVILTFLMLFVVPMFAELVEEMSQGRGIPAATQFAFMVSRNLWKIWGVLIVLIGSFWMLWILAGTSQPGTKIKERIIGTIPLVGKVYTNGLISRFAECMASLVNAGCTLDNAVLLAGQSSGSERLKAESRFLSDQIREGHNFLEAGLSCKLIPRFFLYTAQLGTQRNELYESLLSLAKMYTTKTYSMQNQLQTLLMPAMVVFLGMIVAGFVVSIMLPMVRIVTVMM